MLTILQSHSSCSPNWVPPAPSTVPAAWSSRVVSSKSRSRTSSVATSSNTSRARRAARPTRTLPRERTVCTSSPATAAVRDDPCRPSRLVSRPRSASEGDSRVRWTADFFWALWGACLSGSIRVLSLGMHGHACFGCAQRLCVNASTCPVGFPGR